MKTIANTTTVLLLSFATLLSGCKEIDDESLETPYDPSKAVTFTTQMDAITRSTPTGNAADVTLGATTPRTHRCTPICDASDLTSMGVFCAATGVNDWSAAAALNKMFNEQLNHNSSNWTYQNSNVYWEAGSLADRYTFFAYAPFATANNGITINGSATSTDKPSLKYTVPTDVDEQPDLMVAVPRYNLRPTGSAVALRMKHALTCIGFQIKGNGERVSGISISGVAISGNLAIDGNNIVWTDLSAPANIDFSTSINYDQGQNYYTVAQTMSTNLITANGYLMMIPQTLGNNAKVKITFADATTKEISLNAYTWEADKRIIYNIGITPDGTITVTPDNVSLSHIIHNPAEQITVNCQKDNGDPDPSVAWTLTSADPSWCRLSLTPINSFSAASAAVSGVGTKTVYILATDNGSLSPRQTTLYSGASTLNVVTTVTQWGNPGTITVNEGAGTQPTGTNTYVGAFWKANQTGERVIRIDAGISNANYGDWKATVMWLDSRWGSDDGVVLSIDKLPGTPGADPNIYTSNPDDAEKYQVEGSNNTVTGKVSNSSRYIVFRIGLKSQYVPTQAHPARYAVVLLSYNNNTKHQKIFLRQGEKADYVMTNSDPVSTGGLSSRTQCVKFVPYNLTADLLETRVDISGTTPPVNPGKFTDYPTQAGAFFQWVNTSTSKGGIRWAFSPHTSVQHTWAGLSAPSASTCWNTLAANHETSPSGYRRVNDGSISSLETASNIANSELRQSLFSRPRADWTYGSDVNNSTWGYYADGFFDRRLITDNATVSSGSRNIAHIGRLFFNPVAESDHYNASLFFPAAGFLSGNASGMLAQEGIEGMYWTSTKPNYNGTASALLVKAPTKELAAAPYHAQMSNAASIRCVEQ
jgi:hypothetical protein